MSDNEIVEQNKECKTKDYVRRANNKYRKKKYYEDEEYRKKKLEYSKLNYKKNKEKYKEKRKLYMKEYNARKKQAKILDKKPDHLVNKEHENIEILFDISKLSIKT
jgi:hypothetical protein